MLEALCAIAAGSAVWTAQGAEGATYAQRIEKAELRLSPELPVLENCRRVKASSPAAPARARVCGKDVTVLDAEPACDGAGEPAGAPAPGEVVFEKRRLLLGCADGALALSQVKPDGKKAMEARAWMAGLQQAPRAWEAL